MPRSRWSTTVVRPAEWEGTAAVVLLMCTIAAGCGTDRRDRARNDSAAGEVAISMITPEARASRAVERSMANPVQFELTDSTLLKLRDAQTRLRALPNREGAAVLGLDVRDGVISPARDVVGPIARDIEQHAAVRQAIEGAGLSVRDYVQATFALQQALLVERSARGEALPAILAQNLRVVSRNGDVVAAVTDSTPFDRVVLEGLGGEVVDTHRVR